VVSATAGTPRAAIPHVNGGAKIPAAVSASATHAISKQKSIPSRSAAGLDSGAVIERVQHHVGAGPSGSLQSTDAGFRATFTAGGFGLTLRRQPTSSEKAAVRRQLSGLPKAPTVAGAPASPVPKGLLPKGLPASAYPFRSTPSFRISVHGNASRWHSRYNVAERRLSAALSERVTSLTGRLHWDFVLHRAVRGSLAIHARVSAAGPAQHVNVGSVRGVRGQALRWSTGDGTDVLMGGYTVRDANGHKLYSGIPRVAGSRLTLSVPAGALRGAALPVTVDPTITSEYPTALPVYMRSTYWQYDPAVAASGTTPTGTTSLVVWEDCRYTELNSIGGYYYCHIWGARVSGSGLILDPAGIPMSVGSSTANSFQFRPRVAWNGSNKWLVVWIDYRNGNYDIYGTTVDTTGTVLNPNGIDISDNSGTQYYPEVAFNGSTFLVAWLDERNFGTNADDIYGARVASDGTVLTTPGTDLAIDTNTAYQQTPQIAVTGSQFLVAWHDSRNFGATNWDIWGTRVDSGGNITDGVTTGFVIDQAAGGQVNPSVASSGSEYFVVWQDQRSGNYDIWGIRVTTLGTLNGAEIGPINVATIRGNLNYDQTIPNVVWTGTNNDYLVAWQDNYLAACCYGTGSGYSDIGTELVAANGTLVYGQLMTNSSRGSFIPRMAWNGQYVVSAFPNTDFLQQQDADFYLLYYYGGVVQGTVASNVANDQSSNTSPAIAYDPVDNLYMVAWYDDRTAANGTDVYAARIQPNGAMLDGSGIPVATAFETQGTPQIAWNGSEFLIVYDTYQNGNWDVYGTRVSPNGLVLDHDGIPISTVKYRQGVPAVASDGTNFLVAWQDYRDQLTKNPDIWGARVAANGTVLDAGGLQIVNDNFYDDVPHIAFNGSNYLVVWHAFTNLSGSSNYDVQGQMVSPAGSLTGSTVNISVAAANQLYPKVASNGDNFLVVWEDYRDSGTNSNDIYGQLVAANGVLTGGNIPIQNEAPDGQGQPGVGWDGANYLVPYVDTRNGPTTGWDIYAKRVSSTGSVLDGLNGFIVAQAPTSEQWPGVAAGPNGQTAVMYGRWAPSSGSTSYGWAFRQFVRFVNIGLPSVPNLVNPSALFQKSKTIASSWTASSAGENPLTGYDFTYRMAPYNTGTFGAPVNMSVAGTSQSITGATVGGTYCIMVRSHDSLGYHSDWSNTKCTGVPLDDKPMTAKGGFAHKNGAGNYLGTYSVASSKGASLSKSGVTARRLALVATKGPGEGSVKVYIGSKLLGTVSLANGSVKKLQFINLPLLPTLTTGTVKIVSTSSKPVIIDGLGTSPL
jgi:hypothetical protein